MPSENTRSKEPLTNDLSIIIPFALMSIYIFACFRQQEFLILQWSLLGFLVSFLIAIAMVLMLKYLTFYLDQRLSWNESPVIRSVMQFFCTFLVPIFITTMLALGLFIYTQIDISSDMYMEAVFLPIMMYILLVNLYYNPLQVINIMPKEELTFNSPDQVVLKIDLANYGKIKDIVYISITEKTVHAINGAGEFILWDATIEQSIESLPSDKFFRIGRSTIVRIDNIVSVKQNAEKYELEIVLKIPSIKPIHIPRDRIADFNKWWDQRDEDGTHKSS